MFLLWAKNVCTYSPLAKLAAGSDFLNCVLGTTRSGFLVGTEWHLCTFHFNLLNAATLSVLLHHCSCTLHASSQNFSGFTWCLEGKTRRAQRILSVWTPGSVNILVIFFVTLFLVRETLYENRAVRGHAECTLLVYLHLYFFFIWRNSRPPPPHPVGHGLLILWGF